MARFIEEDNTFEDDAFEGNTEGFGEDAEETPTDATDERKRMRQFTERRRRIEDLIEASRIRDELGLYDEDIFNG